jgi:hypothetical protein
MNDSMIGLSERDRMLIAQNIGWQADALFRNECRRLGMDEREALVAPLAQIAMRRYLLAENEKGHA